MKYLKFFIVSFFCVSCINNEVMEETTVSHVETNELDITSTVNDSIAYWTSLEYLKSIDLNISICECWKQNKYLFFSYDTVKMEMFLKSNLMHFGHDSEIILPMKKVGDGFKYDSTSNNWGIKNKEFKIPVNDTLILFDDGKPIFFVKKMYPVRDDQMNKIATDYNDIRSRFYEINSHLLLKYNKIDSVKSKNFLIEPKALKELILNGFVTAHCSDDYYYDGFTIKKDSIRTFQLIFKEKELLIFEHINGRGRFEKVKLDQIPSQTMTINK